jgi:predicted nucleic acid-binding protein
MSFLLDTNVVSEWVKPRPDGGVVAWLREADEDRLFLSVVTLAELRLGIERLPLGTRRSRLDEWIADDLRMRFEGRILTINVLIADAWGRLTAQAQSVGRPIGTMDGFIGATAQVHGLILVTRNVADFAFLANAPLNPWHS